MNKLITEDSRIFLNINGKEFSFVADSEFARRLSDLAAEAGKRAKDCKECGDDEIDASAFLSYAVDTLIGDGAVERIFGDILPDPLDLCDILGYIADAFHAYRKKRINKIKEEYPW